jgi:hypothetical protein
MDIYMKNHNDWDELEEDEEKTASINFVGNSGLSYYSFLDKI